MLVASPNHGLKTLKLLRPNWSEATFVVVMLAMAGALFVVSRYNYLLFHSVVELAAIVTSGIFFTVAVVMLRRAGHDFLFLLAIGFFWSAVIDLVHTLAYKGMGVFPNYTANLPTQLWILARYLEALVILGASLWFGRRLRTWWTPSVFIGTLTVLGIALIFLGWFPTAYVEGSGLTRFKIMSEYVIVAFLLAALVVITRKRRLLSRWTVRWLSGAIVLTICAEICFTRYVGVYGTFNSLGHIFKFLAYATMFRLVVRNMLERPLQALGAIVPVCSRCKAVRVADNQWILVEDLLSREAGKPVSHGLCPSCYQKMLVENGLSEE
ncbi:MAG: hypothetical protein N3B14_02960 [Thermoleophilia bacterium]|nr:hypothetical protein [Thermoleophilia bacterium]